MIGELKLVKCPYCGTWSKPKSKCDSCGGIIDTPTNDELEDPEKVQDDTFPEIGLDLYRKVRNALLAEGPNRLFNAFKAAGGYEAGAENAWGVVNTVLLDLNKHPDHKYL